MVTKSDSNERQRCSTMQLSDLDDGVIVKVASFLPQESSISFAIAMTKKYGDAPSDLCKAITGASIVGRISHWTYSTKSSWESIEFKDIQVILGRALMDDDIKWILRCTDAVHKTKSLKLTGCLGITGEGLEPLRESTVLKYIDLSLVGDHGNPNIQPEPPISAEIVVPILNNILDTVGNSLVHAQLPKKWRVERPDILTIFLLKLNISLKSRNIHCRNNSEIREGFYEWCRKICMPNEENSFVGWRYDGSYERYYGIVDFTCSMCKGSICLSCQDTDPADLGFCECCEKYYCDNCSKVNYCQGNRCVVLTGIRDPRTGGIFVDDQNQKTSCRFCNVVKECDECEEHYCSDCRTLTQCQFGEEETPHVDEETRLHSVGSCHIFCNSCSKDKEPCLNICQGKGCNRANCNGRSVHDGYNNCASSNAKSANYVKQWTSDGGGVGSSGGTAFFCNDCHIKECK